MGIVQSHQGHVRIRTAPGEGTTFRVVLPAVAGEADAGAAPAVRAPDGAGGAPCWWSRTRRAFARSSGGCSSGSASTCSRQWTAWRRSDVLDEHDGAVAAVLLDLSMPRMGGQETVRLLRQRSPDAARRPDERLHRAGGGRQDPGSAPAEPSDSSRSPSCPRT